MQKTKLFIATILGIFMFSCTNQESKPAENKTDNTQTVKTETRDKDSIMFVKAKFIEYKLGDASHYTFEDASGIMWDFGGNDQAKDIFAAKLPVNKSNETNQGWTSNKEMQGKWFDIKYHYKTQPQYTDGPMAQVPVIIEVIATE